jgi:hypothetical protein
MLRAPRAKAPRARVPRVILAGLATLGLGTACFAGQATIAYAAPSEPSVVRVSSSAVGQSTVILDAVIDPGETATVYHFEYGASASYGTSVPVPAGEVGGGSEPVSVGQQLTGLEPGTTYHYRVVAGNTHGTVRSVDETFTTLPPLPPIVSTGQAVEVAQESATLSGTIDTQGYETVYEFDVGADTSYGSRIFGDAGVEPGVNTYTVALEGLQPGTTYHYRVQATNEFGTSDGVDVTFTTGTYPSSVLAVPAVAPLVPTMLLVPAPAPAGTGAAQAASVKAPARTVRHKARAGKAARHGKTKKASESGRGRGRPGGHEPNGSSAHVGRARGANRGGVR